MACDSDDLVQNIENIKTTVRKSFARIYATLKARELKTLRQLDVIRKQCENNKELERNCVQNIKICYDNESTLLDYISNYGVIDFETLNFDSSTFILEDYISPNDDHMYSYKTIEELTEKDNIEELEAIEEAALKQITETEDCVCIVNIQSEDVSRKFRDRDTNVNIVNVTESSCKDSEDHKENNDIDLLENALEETKECSDEEIKKINPTDDWLNSIKNHTETEPSQVTDVMEHSTIACS
ncbi:unnamed protein product [Euphydryas editha]|uniref:Uncharacterized protein n=1 Tax=Euphydryas editha TaxID=104508 RepID=A0AAU9V5G1_EUPED|nr:unnamed protein product [Euphydryas editha]CAH2107014.1 unnamed protein product [Euphydryas editha]